MLTKKSRNYLFLIEISNTDRALLIFALLKVMKMMTIIKKPRFL